MRLCYDSTTSAMRVQVAKEAAQASMNLERAMTRAAQSGLFDEVAASGRRSPVSSWDSEELEALDWGAADYEVEGRAGGAEGRPESTGGDREVAGGGGSGGGGEAQRVQEQTDARVEKLVQRVERQQADRQHVLSSMDGQEVAGPPGTGVGGKVAGPEDQQG